MSPSDAERIAGHDPRLVNVVDLTADHLGFDPRTGAPALRLVNRGGVAVSKPFTIVVSLDTVQTTLNFNAKKDRLGLDLEGRHLPIDPWEQREVTVIELKANQCSSSHSIAVSIDPGHAVADADRTNNQIQSTAQAPCPDLTVVSIEKYFKNDFKTEYGAKVTIKNQGTGSAGRFNVFAVTSSELTGIYQLPDYPFRTYESMDPGQTATFSVGEAVAVEKMWVRVVIDPQNWIAESDKTNNEMRKTLE